ncbi:hypothetical protein BCV69DRAFT_301961 [Microstroma glucosiphilum]|uniref:Uncharacterized protein n=1 Tax=Pseudomicrostroma glucosiphilum TaxID=1684307 RepID=A0A316TWE8_9BASI|nr:hypothetical protein BCV69DRAFT_301961 [Pseudomicrostroma glucosiphilum]PWN17657.1 hypothetical protein BCV69DRAFT_301961 [Pseudomicrostroma glucosiphilum]
MTVRRRPPPPSPTSPPLVLPSAPLQPGSASVPHAYTRQTSDLRSQMPLRRTGLTPQQIRVNSHHQGAQALASTIAQASAAGEAPVRPNTPFTTRRGLPRPRLTLPSLHEDIATSASAALRDFPPLQRFPSGTLLGARDVDAPEDLDGLPLDIDYDMSLIEFLQERLPPLSPSAPLRQTNSLNYQQYLLLQAELEQAVSEFLYPTVVGREARTAGLCQSQARLEDKPSR